MFTTADHQYMTRALELARRGLWTTSPNPRVGCVIVREGMIVGEGWHRRTGEPHAEVLALAEAGGRARGGTAYVTLEPCSHHGRTPPCTDALIAARVGRVIGAMEDPNPLVAGQGFARLREAGIDVRCGLLGEEAKELNIGFVARMTRGRPWLRLKTAASLDGRTALSDGRSQWITGAAARSDGHAWRARACAIMTGMGTMGRDDPRLDVREVPTDRQPLKVLVDAHLGVDLHARLLVGGQVLIATAARNPDKEAELVDRGCEILHVPQQADPAVPDRARVDLVALVQALAARGCNEVHVEGGRRLNGALIGLGLADELLYYMAPALMGAGPGPYEIPEVAALDARHALEFRDVAMVGDDLRLLARFVRT